jgi:hypothetical protein
LLEREAGSAVRLDSSPTVLTVEKMFVAPLFFWGELAGEEAQNALLRARHG